MILIRFCCPWHLLKTILLLFTPSCLPPPWDSSHFTQAIIRVSHFFWKTPCPSSGSDISKAWLNMRLFKKKRFYVEGVGKRVTRGDFHGATGKGLSPGFSCIKSLLIRKGVCISLLCSSFSSWSPSLASEANPDQWGGGRISFQQSPPVRSTHLLTPSRNLQQGPAFPQQNISEWVLLPGETLSRSCSERTPQFSRCQPADHACQLSAPGPQWPRAAPYALPYSAALREVVQTPYVSPASRTLPRRRWQQ